MARATVAGTPADPVVPFAVLEIEGEKFKLAFDFNAIAEAEHYAGCNLLSGLKNLGDLTALQLRGLLYAAMRKAHPKVTIEKAGSLIRLDTIVKITLALGEAYSLSMPKRDETPTEAEDAAAGSD